MESIPVTLVSLINWGWLQIGPYIHLNMNPVILHIGPLALRWYGLMYVVAIVMGLWLIRRYTARKGIRGDQVYRLVWWCVVAGLVGGGLYFVIQQPDLVQPAAGYEVLFNLILIVVLLFLARRYRRPGMLMITYLFGYAITEFLVFFVRANIVVPLFTLDWGLKQAQWTSLIVFLLLIPLTLWARCWRYAEVIPEGEIPATYGIPQKQVKQATRNVQEESEHVSHLL